MAFEKIFGTTAGVYGTAANWRLVSLRNASYSWTLSGSGTNEYYLRTSGGANPGLTATPTSVYLNGASVTSGSLGSLTAGHWAYGNNDTLGYNTLYVRTSGSVDPDTLSADYVQMLQTPIAADNVTIPVGAYGVIDGSDQSSVAINRFVTEKGWTGTVGSNVSDLRIDPDFLEWNGGGGFLNIGAAAIPVSIRGTNTPTTGYRSLTLRGSAITSLDLQSGSLELPTGSAATAVSMSGGELYLASGSTVSDIAVNGGTLYCRGTFDDLIAYAGRVWLYGTVTGTVTVEGSAEVIWVDGTLPAVAQNGGTFDERQSGLFRTCSEFRLRSGQHFLNYEAVTHSDYDITRSLNVSAGSSWPHRKYSRSTRKGWRR